MSDIEDILAQFNSTPQGPEGVARYVPDPAEFGRSYNEQTQQGWEGLKQAGSDMWNQGAGPVNVGQAALSGLQLLASPFTAFGSYLGGPVERGVSDLTGSPTAGKVIGDTVALAPSLVMPFPGSKMMSTAAEAGGAMLGESVAARSVADNVAPFVASKFAPAAAARSDIDDILEEASGATRQTTKAKSIEDELALKWYADQFKGGGGMEDLPPLNPASRKTIRLLEKGNPKVGENKYARNEAGEQTTMSYENQGERPTYRTGGQAAEPTRQYPPVWDEGGYPMTNLGTMQNADPAPLLTYENAFRREFEPSNVALGSPPSQTPLGRNPLLDDMHLPNVRENAELDPNLLAELKLKFGGGSPQGGADPRWMQQENAGWKQPRQTNIPGATPMPSREPVVQFPSEGMPVSMGVEARGNTNRLRGDLGLPPDPKEALRGKPPIPDNPGTPAKPGISNYGEVVVGQPYDIVHAVGSNEMRAPGGVVKEMTTINEPVVKNGKMGYEPMVYGILEDGRRVPAKMLKPAGAQQPNVSAMSKSSPKSQWTKGEDMEDIADDAEGKQLAGAAQFNNWMSKNHSDLWKQFWIEKDAGKLSSEVKFKVEKLEDQFYDVKPGSTEKSQWSDPAFEKLRSAMQKKVDEATGTVTDAAVDAVDSPKAPAKIKPWKGDPEILEGVTTGLKKSRKQGKITYEQLKQYLPEGVSKTQIDKAVKHLQQMQPTLKQANDPKTKESYVVYTKLHGKEQEEATNVSVARRFSEGMDKLRSKHDTQTSYLHNFAATHFQNEGIGLKSVTVAKKLTEMIKNGEVRVHGENSGKTYDTVNSGMFNPDRQDEDLLITFLNKKSKADK